MQSLMIQGKKVFEGIFQNQVEIDKLVTIQQTSLTGNSSLTEKTAVELLVYHHVMTHKSSTLSSVDHILTFTRCHQIRATSY